MFVAEKAKQQPVAVPRARAVAGRGLLGDRYFIGKGTFSHWGGTGRALTIVEAEALEEIGLDYADARRNVVVRGVSLNPLVGRRFRIGGVELQARRLCEPCRHLERVAERDDLLRALVNRGGIRVDVLSDGEMAVGDSLVQLDGA
jgi:MOSC domain-containing protein YiiM